MSRTESLDRGSNRYELTLDALAGLAGANITAYGNIENAKRPSAATVIDTPIDLADLRSAALHFATPVVS